MATVLLISTYDLGRQPFGLASPAAWLRQAGFAVVTRDLSRERLLSEDVAHARLVAFYLPMHTATRLALPVIDRVRGRNPEAHVCAYGLYAPLNDTLLRDRGVSIVLGPEAEQDLVTIASGVPGLKPGPSGFRGEPALGTDLVPIGEGTPGPKREPSGVPAVSPTPGDVAPGVSHAGRSVPRLSFITPDRSTLPPLSQYAALQMPDGSRRIAGATDATRGCKHRCRHCPIVPVYEGRFRAVPVEVVLADIEQQVAQGARHITFGDPDFFNGPMHARRLVESLPARHPALTYDVTIKIEHLLRHRDLLPVLAATGCAFITSAVESVDDEVLARLEKGHTRADFIEATHLVRASRLTLAPTFVAFTPWTTPDGFVDLLEMVAALDLVEHVSPVQWALRLLVTYGSRLLALEDIRTLVGPFSAASLTYPWRHPDPRVDELQEAIAHLVGVRLTRPRAEIFQDVCTAAGLTGTSAAILPARATIPYLDEPWYC